MDHTPDTGEIAEATEAAVTHAPPQDSWFARLRGAVAPQRPEPSGTRDANPLMQFASESASSPSPSTIPTRGSQPTTPRPPTALKLRKRFAYSSRAVVAGAILVLGVAAVPVSRVAVSRQPLANWFRRAQPTATLTVQTRPAGAAVLIDGQAVGVSPLTLPIAVGEHKISARVGTAERVVPFTFAAGAQVVQFLEIEQPVDLAAAARQTRMSVTTDPPGARVEIDGTLRGRSPVSVSDLIAGSHRVSVVSDAASAERTVVTSPESAVSVVFNLSPSRAQSTDGWAVVQAPFDVQLLEHGDVIGTSGAKLMMTAGTHQITVRNQQLGYEDSRKIVVASGKTVSVNIAAPTASLSVNARPWADVTIDGEAAGQTPLANVSIGIGVHQVVFRHPQFGEHRQSIVVTTKGPNRVAVDFTKRQ